MASSPSTSCRLLPLRLASLSLAILCTLGQTVSAADPEAPANAPAAPPAPRAATARATTAPASQPQRIAAFQPGIRFDWSRREVLADATVVLREGLIELFACSPRQREHEAIVRMEARPLHLYQALGLIGIRPGHPIRFNEQDQVDPATGDAVEIEIRYQRDGRTVQEPIERWMRFDKSDRSPGGLPWVFAGSLQMPDGFAADFEGTVIALVDFGGALIALPELHSSSNEELWLAPATERIPPLGTRCELVFRAGPLRIVVDGKGRTMLNGETLTRAELARGLAAAVREDPAIRVDLTVDPRAPRSQREGIEQLIRMVGVREERISTSQPAASTAPQSDAGAFEAWLARQSGASDEDARDPAPHASAAHLLDDLRERGILLQARAAGLSASLSALSQQMNGFFSETNPAPPVDAATSE